MNAAIVQPALPDYAATFTGGFESCRLIAYNRDGHWTWGFGHVGVMPDGAAVGPNTTGSCQLAHDILLSDLAYASSAATRAATAAGIQLTQPQLVALTDVLFNCGVGLVSPAHTLGQKLAAGDMDGVGRAILLYENATIDGVRGPYLRDRRQHDYAEFKQAPIQTLAAQADPNGLAQVEQELAAAGDQIHSLITSVLD